MAVVSAVDTFSPYGAEVPPEVDVPSTAYTSMEHRRHMSQGTEVPPKADVSSKAGTKRTMDTAWTMAGAEVPPHPLAELAL